MNSVPEAAAAPATADGALARAVLAGEPGAERQFFDIHAPRLWRVLYRVTGDYDEAHDLTQEAILHGLRKIRGFDGRGSLAAWVARLGINLARDEFRKRRRRAERISGFDAGAPRTQTGDALLKARVAEAMDSLKEDERIVVLMHDMEGYTHEEIGRTLDIAAGSSRARLSRARARLREQLRNLHEEDGP